MSRRRLVLPLLVLANLVIFAEHAAARQVCFSDDSPEIVTPASTTMIAAAVKAIGDATVQTPQLQRPRLVTSTRMPKSTLVLGSLYASTAVMQGLDIHSTFKGLERGAAEANPIMGGLVKNRPAFIATKSLVAGGTILAAHEVAKKSKVAAVVTLVALNAMYGYIVNHNYALARRLQ